MNTFNRKSLYVALLGAGAVGVAGTAEAVAVNPNGLGEALIYPYYTVNPTRTLNAYNSLLSVVNTGDSVLSVKVRFLEGKNSQEVLDFNLFLSPYDVWTAGLVPNAAGGARMITADLSCTIPPIPAAGVDFVNFQYSGSNDDGAGSGLDRTREGYIEIIAMASYAPTSTVAKGATHSAGKPSCTGVNDTNAAAEARPYRDNISVANTLFGGISLVNVLDGALYSEDAVALANFAQGGAALYHPAGDPKPDLRDANPVSQILVATGGTFGDTLYSSDWSSGNGCNTLTPPQGCEADAVSAALMHNAVMNEFVLDTGTKSGTDWVVTMPTKRFYINIDTGNAPRLFQRNFNGTAGSCDDVSLFVVDREEFKAPTSFSPPPPTLTNSLCWEANVITFRNTAVLGSNNVSNVPTTFQNGWMRLGFPFDATGGPRHNLQNTATTITTLGGSTTANIVTYRGLPVVGFAVQSFNNGTVPGSGGVGFVQSSYGGNFVQKATTLIQ